jgi:colicin import membrane protein
VFEEKLKKLSKTESALANLTKALEKKENRKLEAAKASANAAEIALKQAHAENAAATSSDEAKRANAETEKNRAEKAPEVEHAKQEVKVVEEKRTEIVNNQKAEIETMMKKAQSMSGEAHDEQIRAVEAKKAEHATELNKQTERIKVAREKLSTVEFEITQPTRVLEERQRNAQKAIEERKKEFNDAKSHLAEVEKEHKNLEKTIKTNAATLVGHAEKNAAEEIHRIATKTAGIEGGHTGTHEVEHVFEEKLKKLSKTESALANLTKALEKKEPPAAGGEEAH